MGCGQSNEDSEQKNKNNNNSAENESAGGAGNGEKQQKEDAKSETSKPATKKSDGGPRDSNASPQNTSLSPQNGSMNQSGALGSSSSFASAPGVTMPTHTITDSTGHKVTSCIGSRNKLETVTRWLDSVVRHREALPESKWRNPQDEAGREKQLPVAASSSQHSGATPSERSGYVPSPSPGHGQQSTASASQLSLQVPGSSTAGVMNESTLSNQPFHPQTPQNAEMLASPAPGGGGTSPKFEKLSNSQSPAPAQENGGGAATEKKAGEEGGGASPQGPNETSKTNPPTPREEEKKETVEATA